MSQSNQHIPPKIPLKLMRLFVDQDYLEEIEGDMEEIFNELLEEHSLRKARRIYAKECLLLMRPILVNFTKTQKLNIYGMIRLFFKTAQRNFMRHKLVSTMSLVTLVLGSVFYQVINAWLQNERAMDQFHSNIDQIHMGVARTNPKADLSPISLQLFFNLDYSQFPSIQKVSKVHVYRPDEIKVITPEYEHTGKGLVVDSTFTEIFDFELVNGSIKGQLNNPSNILVTQSFASKLFVDGDAVGQTVDIKCDQLGTYQIAGILKDLPSSSSITFDFLLPTHSQKFWRRIPHEVFLTDEHFVREEFNERIATLGRSNERFPESVLSSFPLKSIYYDRPFEISLFGKYGDSKNFQTMSIVSLLILFITAISFVNLQTTLQLSLVKKLGVKKVIGASNFDLSLEIVVSRVFYFLLATILGLGIYTGLENYIQQSFELQLDSKMLENVLGIASVTSIAVFISLLISYFKVLKIKGKEAISGKMSFLGVPKMQRVLTTIQYAVTVVLLIGSTVIFYQFQFMLNKDTGIRQNGIISVDFFEMMTGFSGSEERLEMERRYELVRNKLSANPDIVEISQGSMPINNISKTSWKLEGGTDEYTTENKMYVDPGYYNLFGLNLIEGRFFNDSLDQSGDLKVVINEAAKKYYGIEQIEGTQLMSNTSGRREFKFDVIGVVEDYHYEHLSQAVKPLILQYRIYEDESFLLAVNEINKAETIGWLEKLFRSVNTGGIFTFDSMENLVEAQYKKEELTGKIYLGFGIVALLLSSIGLFTFALHETKRRTKEIGIRKVNGASRLNVFTLMSGSFIKTIAISLLIGFPFGWYFTSDWLSTFAYRTNISLWIYVIVGMIVMSCAFIAVLWQTIRISKANPVESLRYE